MESVAQEQGGTAWMVGHGAPYRMAAKTGSAQVAGLRQDESRPVAQELLPLRLRDHALFIAFAPADDPKIAVAVIAEHGGHGASFAGPIARQVMDQYLLGYVLYGNEKATEKSSRSEEHTSELQSLMRISYAVFCLQQKKLLPV